MTFHHFSSELLAEYYESILDPLRVNSSPGDTVTDLLKVFIKTVKNQIKSSKQKQNVVLFWADDLAALINQIENQECIPKLKALEEISKELALRRTIKTPVIGHREVTYVWEDNE